MVRAVLKAVSEMARLGANHRLVLAIHPTLMQGPRAAVAKVKVLRLTFI